MIILGINAYHADSSASLLIDGKIVCATEEERFTRIKHWAGLPIQSIEFCLEFAKISIDQVDSICVGRDPKSKIFNKILYGIKNFTSAKEMLVQRLSNRTDLNDLNQIIKNHFGFCPKIHYIEHHRSHLASAFFSSPFNKSTIVSIDGSGDFSTIMIAKGENSKIEVLASQDFPVSLGILYSAFTQFLGFPYYGDEYKVMGLSPYGKPAYLKELRSIVWSGKKSIIDWDKRFFSLRNGAISYENNQPVVPEIFSSYFEKLFGKKREKSEPINQRHKDIACSLQRRTEEIIFEILEKAFLLGDSKNICIAGGVAQNSVANGKIIKNLIQGYNISNSETIKSDGKFTNYLRIIKLRK